MKNTSYFYNHTCTRTKKMEWCGEQVYDIYQLPIILQHGFDKRKFECVKFYEKHFTPLYIRACARVNFAYFVEIY